MNRNTKRIAAIGMPLAAVAASGIAFAAWSASGTGSGYSKADGISAVATQDDSGNLDPQLFPGGTGDVSVDVTNSNPYAVTVTAVSLSDAVVEKTSAGSDCAPTNFTLDQDKGLTGLSQSIDPNGGDHVFTIANALTMKPTAPEGCKSVTVTINLNNTAGSNAITAGVGS